MEDIQGDADELGNQLLLPFMIIIGVILLATFAYCLFQRLSRVTAKVQDIGSSEEVQKAKERAAALRKDLELQYDENSSMSDAGRNNFKRKGRRGHLYPNMTRRKHR